MEVELAVNLLQLHGVLAVGLAVAVHIGLPDHRVGLRVRERLAQVRHDDAQLRGNDVVRRWRGPDLGRGARGELLRQDLQVGDERRAQEVQAVDGELRRA